jgi:ketosteroid isomerase-like protein
MPGAEGMMQQDDNVEVAREAFAAFAARDLERLGRTLAEDVSWHTPGAGERQCPSRLVEQRLRPPRPWHRLREPQLAARR